MGKHHNEEYKLSAVKYALRTDNQVETCEVFYCKRSSLQHWLKLYEETGSVVRVLNFNLKKCRFKMPTGLSFIKKNYKIIRRCLQVILRKQQELYR